MCLCLLVALVAPAGAGAAVQARQADAFVGSVGVGVHLGWNDTPYVSEFTVVRQRLEELGVRHLRDDLSLDRADQYARLEALAGAGIGSTLIMGRPGGGTEGLDGLLGVAAGLDGVEALEGPNEYSTMGGDPDWVANLRAYQQRLYEGATANPALAGLPVVGPSIVHGDQDELGDVSPFLDLGNIHSYPQGGPPDKPGGAIDRARLNSGAKPVWATETGYNNALAWSGANRPVPEDVAATYMPRLLFEYWRWGIARTFVYELLDPFPNEDLDDAEAHFGLLRHDLSRKPAFVALRDTIAILADPGAAFAPGQLDLTISESGVVLEEPGSTGLHKVLLQKRDGAFYLALWRTSSIWDQDSGEPLTAPAGPVEVTVEPGIETVSEYRPGSGVEPIRSASGVGDSVSVEVGPAVTILRLTPQGPPSPEPPGPEPPASTPDPSSASTRETEAFPPPPPPTPECRVPKLRGRTVAGARAALRSGHCALGAVRGAHRRERRIVRQWPRPGRILPAGAPVAVKIRGDG